MLNVEFLLEALAISLFFFVLVQKHLILALTEHDTFYIIECPHESAKSRITVVILLSLALCVILGVKLFGSHNDLLSSISNVELLSTLSVAFCLYTVTSKSKVQFREDGIQIGVMKFRYSNTDLLLDDSQLTIRGRKWKWTIPSYYFSKADFVEQLRKHQVPIDESEDKSLA